MDEYLYQRSAVIPVTRRQTKSASYFVEEDETNWHTVASPHSSRSTVSQFPAQETLQYSLSSTSKASSEELDFLLLDPHMLAMATCGHWCPPASTLVQWVLERKFSLSSFAPTIDQSTSLWDQVRASFRARLRSRPEITNVARTL